MLKTGHSSATAFVYYSLQCITVLKKVFVFPDNPPTYTSNFIPIIMHILKRRMKQGGKSKGSLSAALLFLYPKSAIFVARPRSAGLTKCLSLPSFDTLCILLL